MGGGFAVAGAVPPGSRGEGVCAAPWWALVPRVGLRSASLRPSTRRFRPPRRADGTGSPPRLDSVFFYNKIKMNVV